jgi:hypothetical protein
MGLTGRSRTAPVADRNLRSCTLVFLYSHGGLGGAVPDVGGRVGVLARRFEVRETSVVEETEGRVDGNS